MIGTIQLFLSRCLRPFWKPGLPVIFPLAQLMRELLLFIFKCDISPLAKVPYSTKFPHHIGIVIGACTMGENCLIRPNVVIGRKDVEGEKETLAEKRAKFPMLGSNIIIGSNVSILGPIRIGDNSIIGAGSVVLKDVEENGIYAGVPAKKVGEVNVKRAIY